MDFSNKVGVEVCSMSCDLAMEMVFPCGNVGFGVNTIVA